MIFGCKRVIVSDITAAYVFPKTCNEAWGMNNTTAAHDANQHLANNFQELRDRKLVDTQGGSESKNDFLGAGVSLTSVLFSACASGSLREELLDTDVLVPAVSGRDIARE